MQDWLNLNESAENKSRRLRATICLARPFLASHRYFQLGELFIFDDYLAYMMDHAFLIYKRILRTDDIQTKSTSEKQS